MQCHVIYGSDIARDLQNLFEVDDLAVVLNSKHPPCCIIQFITQSLQMLKLEESRRNMLVIFSWTSLAGSHMYTVRFPSIFGDFGCSVEQLKVRYDLVFDDISYQAHIMQESKISCFHEGISVCEQLIGTPIPLSYTRLTSRFLVLWHLTLPIILWDDCHWIVVPATFISAASLFCIEEVCPFLSFPDVFIFPQHIFFV